MPMYHIAMIRFSPHGRLYPVNDRTFSEPGERVIVRMVTQGNSLARAEVVKYHLADKPVKNSIVCKEDKAEAYGEGPPGIETAVDLQRYLALRGYRQFSTVSEETIHPVREPRMRSDEWPIAYYVGERWYPDGKLPNLAWGPATIIVFSQTGVARRTLSENSAFHVKEDKIVLDNGFSQAGREGHNPYREVAEWIESGWLIHDLDPRDDSLSQIGAAVSDGGGYLSDGVKI